VTYWYMDGASGANPVGARFHGVLLLTRWSRSLRVGFTGIAYSAKRSEV